MIGHIVKTVSASTGLFRKKIFSRYNYMFEPDQLHMLMMWLRRTRNVPGCYVEIGCAFGATTILLKKYMDRLGIQRRCVAIDTFSGFIEEQAEHDINTLRMSPALTRLFKNNKREWFVESLNVNEVYGVDVIQGDASLFEYSSIGPIAYCLLDVDLYKPIADILPKVWDCLSPGGIIIVDDCAPSPMWEGALVAYQEFVAGRGLPNQIVAGKLGLIRGRGKIGSSPAVGNSAASATA